MDRESRQTRRRRTRRAGLFGLMAAVCLTAGARGATAPATDHVTPVLFPRGTLTLQAYSTYAGALDRDAELGSGTIGVGYYFVDNVSLSLEAAGYREFITGPDTHDAWGYGLSAILRSHFVTRGRATLFSDVAFGPVQSTARIPSGGTYYNYAFRSGVGATYQLDDHLHLMAGVRYFHLSNAHLEGSRRNPSMNGLEGFLGVMWTF